MDVTWLLLIAVGLSMDAFAVAVAKGLSMRTMRWGHALVIALFFGVFQGVMPLIGWALGSSFSQLIEPVDHWVIFAILVAVGGKMIWDGMRGDEEDACRLVDQRLDVRELILLAVATSIDALAVGVSFALMQVNIGLAAGIIAGTTFALSLVGVLIGHLFGGRFQRASGIIGGVVLVLIGCKVLLEHLGVLSF
ncbi:manganese efflux pump MntP [Adlercreutzia murintestinalis]|uniref:manganese efflux pump MntP n=1 Tax=Adlercreutzia murintestinalis TaxID=2941325 RepID=UPI0020422EF8|nr:manganese efflux pump MntP family protein [Adlercreutzia murintestinalis]